MRRCSIRTLDEDEIDRFREGARGEITYESNRLDAFPVGGTMFQCRSVDVVVLMMGSVVVFVCVVNDDLLCVMVFYDKPRRVSSQVAANY